MNFLTVNPFKILSTTVHVRKSSLKYCRKAHVFAQCLKNRLPLVAACLFSTLREMRFNSRTSTREQSPHWRANLHQQILIHFTSYQSKWCWFIQFDYLFLQMNSSHALISTFVLSVEKLITFPVIPGVWWVGRKKWAMAVALQLVSVLYNPALGVNYMDINFYLNFRKQ